MVDLKKGWIECLATRINITVRCTAEWEIQTYNIEGLVEVEVNITNFSSVAGQLEVKVINKRGAIREVINPETGEPIEGFSNASRTYSISGEQNTVLQVEFNHSIEGISEAVKYQITFNYKEKKTTKKWTPAYTAYGKVSKKRVRQEAINLGKLHE